MAARPYSQRDKVMVERAVNIAYTHIYALSRNRVFSSLAALNTAMQEQLTLLNDKPYKKTPYSRRYLYEQQEHALLKTLPSSPFYPKKAVLLTVQRNCHVQLSEDHRYYSVLHKYIGKKVNNRTVA